MPAGLSATATTAAGRLARGLTADLARQGIGGKFRFAEIEAQALPDDARHAVAEFSQATGTRIAVVRNLTFELNTFNGVTFRYGVIDNEGTLGRS